MVEVRKEGTGTAVKIIILTNSNNLTFCYQLHLKKCFSHKFYQIREKKKQFLYRSEKQV